MAWVGARAAASFSGTRVPNALRPAKNSLLLIVLIESYWRHYIDKAPINVRELRWLDLTIAFAWDNCHKSSGEGLGNAVQGR
jgi:hypothetical protein